MGYLWLRVTIRSKRIMVMAHRLVWQHSFGNIPKGKQINHKNGVKWDNRPENLEVVSCRQNILHAFRVIKTRTCKGINHSQHKLKDKDMFEIRERRLAGERGVDLAEEFKVSQATISVVYRSLKWTHLKRAKFTS